MNALYKALIDTQLHQLVVDLIRTQNLTIQEEAIHAITAGIHPFHGEVFTMPWKWGPHVAVQEYNECYPTFEQIWLVTLKIFEKFDWTTKLIEIYK